MSRWRQRIESFFTLHGKRGLQDAETRTWALLGDVTDQIYAVVFYTILVDASGSKKIKVLEVIDRHPVSGFAETRFIKSIACERISMPP
jgi:hypothetical protein